MSTFDDDRRLRDLEAQACKALHLAEFLKHHPEYRDGPPPSEWPALKDQPPAEASSSSSSA